MPCRTVLVIPCYNEAARLRPERFRAFLSAHPEVSLLFVDDGSTDGTAEALGGFEVLRLARNRGKGEAVRQGVLHCLASGRAPDYIGFLDADLAVDPCEAARLTEALEEEPAAWMACASRWRRLGAELAVIEAVAVLVPLVRPDKLPGRFFRSLPPSATVSFAGEAPYSAEFVLGDRVRRDGSGDVLLLRDRERRRWAVLRAPGEAVE